MYINELKKENVVKERETAAAAAIETSQNPECKCCLFILVSVLDMSWRGQGSFL